MVGLNPRLNLAQLQLDDLAHDRVRDRIVRNHDQAPEKGRRKVLEEIGAQHIGEGLGFRARLLVRAYFHDRIGADIRGQQNDGVLEIDLAPLAVLEHAFVEHLEEQFEHVAVGLLDLVHSTTL